MMLMLGFHYGDVVYVAEQLSNSRWAESRSLVFGYADKRVRDWLALRKFMEGKQVHIVNLAKFINQGLSFDLYFCGDVGPAWTRTSSCWIARSAT